MPSGTVLLGAVGVALGALPFGLVAFGAVATVLGLGASLTVGTTAAALGVSGAALALGNVPVDVALAMASFSTALPLHARMLLSSTVLLSNRVKALTCELDPNMGVLSKVRRAVCARDFGNCRERPNPSLRAAAQSEPWSSAKGSPRSFGVLVFVRSMFQ